MSIKKNQTFIVDRAGELRRISIIDKDPTRCVRNCKGMYMDGGKLYCNYTNDIVYVDGKFFYRNDRCKAASLGERGVVDMFELGSLQLIDGNMYIIVKDGPKIVEGDELEKLKAISGNRARHMNYFGIQEYEKFTPFELAEKPIDEILYILINAGIDEIAGAGICDISLIDDNDIVMSTDDGKIYRIIVKEV